MPKRPCIVCGTLGTGSYCSAHQPKQGSRAWRGGSSRRWRELRERALRRDGHACVRCGASEGLTAHHVLSRAEGGRDVLANVRTLCGNCHAAAHRG